MLFQRKSKFIARNSCSFAKNYFIKINGGIHKPRGELRGMGVCQMNILQHKPYLVKWSTKGKGVGQKSAVYSDVNL